MRLELLAVFFIPWIMDLIGGRAIMGTLFGSLLWGTAILLVSARAQIRDSRISKTLLLFTWALGGAWVSYWLFAFTNEPQHSQWLGKPLQWLAWAHAGILSAGAALIAISGVFASLWLWGERRIRKGSWARRSSKIQIPSLEASSRMTARALVMGAFMWTCGLLLAATNGFIQWSAGVGAFANETDTRWTWASDSKFVVASVLWGMVVTGLTFVLKLQKSSKLKYFAILGLSIVFVLGFYCLLTLESNTRHIPVRWFIK